MPMKTAPNFRAASSSFSASRTLATRMDPARDVTILDRTPMDYLDFASPLEGLAGKMGIDATTKIGAETSREWGRVMETAPDDAHFAADLVGKYFPDFGQ